MISDVDSSFESDLSLRVLAKMAATLDQICGGRFVLGLGAGWEENEHRQYGIPFYTVKQRLERLAEACQLIKSLFANETTTFRGTHYTLSNAVLEPKPVQRPLPLLIGGGGEKVTLRIAARFADEWNVWGDVARLRHKMAILDRYCAELGRPTRAIQRSAVALLFLTDDRDLAEKLRSRPIDRPSIIGNVDEVRDIVRVYREAGVDELIVPDFTLGPRDQKLATLDRFIREVAAPLLSLAKKLGNHSLSARFTPGYQKEFLFATGESIIINDTTTQSLEANYNYKELFGLGYSYRFDEQFNAGLAIRFFSQDFNQQIVKRVFGDTLYLVRETIGEN